eukprot:13426372-Alexandrium_andersonii.AAC.1
MRLGCGLCVLPVAGAVALLSHARRRRGPYPGPRSLLDLARRLSRVVVLRHGGASRESSSGNPVRDGVAAPSAPAGLHGRARNPR